MNYSEEQKFLLFFYPASDLERCHFSDKVCLKRVIASYSKDLRLGRRDLGLVPVDPLQIDEVNIIQGDNSPVNVNLKFRDLKGYGLSSATILDVA